MDQHFISYIGKAAYALAVAALVGLGAKTINTAERVAVVERQQETVDAVVTDRLDRMEGKIDLLLERNHVHDPSQR